MTAAIEAVLREDEQPGVHEAEVAALGIDAAEQLVLGRILEGERWALLQQYDNDGRPLYAPNPHAALTLADSTVLEVLPRLARAACAQTRVHKRRDGSELHAFRLHTQLDLRTFQPLRIDRTGACNAGELRESAMR